MRVGGYAITGYLSYEGCYKTAQFVAPRDGFPQSGEALEHALALDPELASAQASLGYAHLFFEWDFDSPRALFKTALSLEPSSVSALCDSGRYLSVVGDATLAAEVFARAAVLDPYSPVTRLWMGWGHYMARRYSEAAAVFEAIVEAWPAFVYGRLWLATALAAMGRSAPAAGCAAEVARTSGVSDDHNLLCVLGFTYAQFGDAASAEVVLAQLQAASNAERFRDPAFLGCIHGALGAFDRAIEELRMAYEQRSLLLVYLDRHPMFEPLRQDPRFLELCLRTRMASKLPAAGTSSSS